MIRLIRSLFAAPAKTSIVSRPRPSRQLRLETLEERWVPAVDVWNSAVPMTPIHGGDIVRIADTTVQSSTHIGRVQAIDYAAAPGTELKALRSATAQLDWNNDGRPDYNLGAVTINQDYGLLTVNIPRTMQPLFGMGRAAHVTVTGTFNTNAPAVSDQFGLEILGVKTVSLTGQPQSFADQAFHGVPYTQVDVRPVAILNQVSIGKMNTAIRNEFVTLMAWDGHSTGDVSFLNDVPVRAAYGSLTAFHELSIWADVTGDNVVDVKVGSVVPSGTQALISIQNGLGQALEINQNTRFELKGKIASSAPLGIVAVGFDTTRLNQLRVDESDFDPMSGVNLNKAGKGDITLYTATPKIINILASGSLSFSKGISPIRPQYAELGTLGASQLNVTVRAENEGFLFSRLNIGVIGTARDSVDRVEVYTGGTLIAVLTKAGVGSSPVPTTYNGQPMSVYGGMSSYYVLAKGQEATLQYKLRYNSDSDGGTTGNATPIFYAGGYPEFGATAFTAFGTTSSYIASGPKTAIVGTTFDVVGAAITKATNADPNANGSNISTGWTTIARWKFTGGNGFNPLYALDKSIIDALLPTVKTTNVALDKATFQIFNLADVTQFMTCAVVETSPGNYQLSVIGLSSSWINTTVSYKEDMTLALRVYISNPKVVSSLSSSLQVFLSLDTIEWLEGDALGYRKHVGLKLADNLLTGSKYQS